MITRRQFVTNAISLALVGCTSTIANAASPVLNSPRGSLKGPLRQRVFLALIGQTFLVSGRSRSLTPMILTKVQNGRNSSAKTEQFSLVFAGPRDVAFLEGIYTIKHPVVGETKMLLQPRGKDAYNRFYEAPFNLLL